MSKIFRLGTAGSSTYQDWSDCGQFPYGRNNRDTIQDPNGASARKEITSIPSPFARIDLVKNAFAEIVRSGRLDGNTIFHKMVSDALDVGEIFFNMDKYRDDIEIIVWDCRNGINELVQSANKGHRYLGDALEKYLVSDSLTYNFDRLQNIYLLNYKNGPKQINIIGATSPATVFFSNANNLDFASSGIHFGQDNPFDEDLQPLYKRDFEYVKSWFYLRNVINDFSRLFPEVSDYLDLTFRNINDPVKKDILNNIASAQFGELDFSGTNQIEILGYPLYKRTGSGTFQSDFEIKPSMDVTTRPLVLPVSQGTKYSDLLYTTDKWGRYNQAPCHDGEDDITKRRLPNDGMVHPYLTVSDFLEETIIRVDHRLDKEAYFDGNATLVDNKRLSYLLPLKPCFFSYFLPDDLLKGLPSGKKMMEMEELGGGISVKVTLRIPIKGRGNVDHIEYSRIYYGGNCDTSIERNEGRVAELSFDGFVMPRIRFADAEDAIYKVGCVSTSERNYEFRFYEGDKILSEISQECRNQNSDYSYCAKTYTIEKKNFDYLQVVDNQGNRSLVLPVFKEQRVLDKFVFAVDFGTSNTHVEYVSGAKVGLMPQPLHYDKGSCLFSAFFKQSFWITEDGERRIEDLGHEKELEKVDFLPDALGDKAIYKFPTRTVLSHSRTVDWSMSLRPFGYVNIPFTYNAITKYPYNDFETNLKWRRDGNTPAMIDAFLESLMLTIRNFVVANDGNLADTTIIWFYPISMSTSRVNSMRNAWNRITGKYFKGCATKSITESYAPTRYFFNRLATATNLVNIDIGGGTTDIAYAINKKLDFVTSFKFAANDIFENTLLDEPRYPQYNGIVDFFKDGILTALHKVSEPMADVVGERDGMPSEMASLFFSLKENDDVKGLNPNDVDFALQLGNSEEFKIVFVIFYTAIIYHLAKILSLRNLSMPRHMTFSGNGSKIINVITNGNVGELQNYTKMLFGQMQVAGSDGIIEILGLSGDVEPKQSTCKGGILAANADLADDGVEPVVLKGDGSAFVTSKDTFAGIDDAYVERTATEVRTFFDFVLNKVNQVYNFNKKFGASNDSLGIAREVCFTEDIKTFIKRGKTICEADAAGNPQVEETLFFYPIKGMLSSLSARICEKYKNRKGKLAL